MLKRNPAFKYIVIYMNIFILVGINLDNLKENHIYNIGLNSYLFLFCLQLLGST